MKLLFALALLLTSVASCPAEAQTKPVNTIRISSFTLEGVYSTSLIVNLVTPNLQTIVSNFISLHLTANTCGSVHKSFPDGSGGGGYGFFAFDAKGVSTETKTCIDDFNSDAIDFIFAEAIHEAEDRLADRIRQAVGSRAKTHGYLDHEHLIARNGEQGDAQKAERHRELLDAHNKELSKLSHMVENRLGEFDDCETVQCIVDVEFSILGMIIRNATVHRLKFLPRFLAATAPSTPTNE